MKREGGDVVKDKAFVEAIIDRMKHVVGVTKDSELAEVLGAHRTGPAVWKSRPSLPINEIMKLAHTQNVSLDWLIFGRGSPSYTGGPVKGEKMDDRVQPKEIGDTILLPVFDLASAADIDKPATLWRASTNWLHAEGLSDAEDETIIVRAASDAMAPTILDGQLVAVDRRPADIDGVFLIRIGQSLRFKRLQKMLDGSLRIISDNKAYADEVVSSHEASKIEIIGYCAAVFARIG